MKAAEPASPSAATLRVALLDYFEAPGKYQLTLRQPALLFSSIREILQIASGRGAADAADSARLGDAANFFIRAALLYPGADHYAVLGLAPGEVPPDVKERYRLLMRMIHPDFAQGSAAWPTDAATRVNRAYEVLSSPVLRREYDDQLASLRTQRPASAAGHASFQPAPRRVDERQSRVGKKAALVFGVAVGVPALLLLVMPRTEPDHLVQRSIRTNAGAESAPVEPELPAHTLPGLASSEPVGVEAAAVPGSVLMAPAAAAPAPAPVAVAPSTPAPAPAPERPGASPARTAETALALAPAKPLPRAPVPTPAPAPLRNVPAPVVGVARPITLARTEEPTRAAPVVAAAIAPVSMPVPAVPAPAPAAAPAPVAVAAAVTTVSPSTSLAAKLTTTLALPSAATPTLADAQPLLTQMLQILETGNGDQLLRLLDNDARKQPAAVALSRQYDQLAKGHTVHLTQVEFAGEPREGGVLLVTGKIRLQAGEPTIGSFGQKLLLRAEFAQRAGKVQLTALSGTSD